MPKCRKITWQCEKTPKFSAAQFAYIAEIIRKMQIDAPTRLSCAMYMGHNLRHTNPRFNMDAFLTACSPVEFMVVIEKQQRRQQRKKKSNVVSLRVHNSA